MRIDLKDKQVGETFQIIGDTRWFKCFEYIANEKKEKVVPFKFYGYSFLKESSTWILDYDEARRLARINNLKIEYSKITHTIPEEIFVPHEKREYYDFWSKTSTRYIAEAKVIDDVNNEIYFRIGSSGADNVRMRFLSYRPEIACKRATVRCIIDILGLQDMVVEFEEDSIEPSITDDKKIEPQIDDNQNKNKITEAQIEMIKKLLKSKKKKFSKKKYLKMTEEEAGNIINKLKE